MTYYQKLRERQERMVCQVCGRSTADPAEFHPYEMCLLLKAGQTYETIWDFIKRSQVYLGTNRGTFKTLRDVDPELAAMSYDSEVTMDEGQR